MSREDLIRNLLGRFNDKLTILEHNEVTYESSLKECSESNAEINSILFLL